MGLAGGVLAIGLSVTERAGAGSFRSTGEMNVARDSSTATLLPPGKVLIAGGFDDSSAVLSSAELYDDFFRFSFTNTPETQFRVLATPAPHSPIGHWTILGGVPENSPGQFEFTDTEATNSPRRFYRLRSP